jgi:translocation and assembly module TamA
MTLGRALAAAAAGLAMVLGLGGCASLTAMLDTPLKPAATPGAAVAAATTGGQATASPEAAGSAAAAATAATLKSLRVEIEAPPELKALLERHLDLIRLGRLASDDIDDSEWQRLIDATPGQVRELLQTEGYFNAGVKVQRVPAPDGERNVGVQVQVTAGVQARVQRVTLQVDGDIERAAAAGDLQSKAALDKLLRGWDLPEGAAFRNASWNSAKAVTLARLRAAGYATATWSGTQADVDPDSNGVRLFLVADSGPLFRFGELQIEGLVVQDPETVRNLFAASRGDALTETMLLDFQDRLQKAKLFESIGVALDIDPAQAGQARVTVRLRESPIQEYTFGLGISANTGPRASVEQTYRRVFGYAALLRNKAEYGQLRKAWDGEISTHAAEDLYRDLVGGAVEQLKSDTDIVLSQSVRAGRTQDGQRIERLLFAQAERSVRKTLDDTVRTAAIAVSLNYHQVWRDLDSNVLPTQGLSLKGQIGAGYSHGTDAQPGPYTRLYARLTGYQPVGRSWYGQARIEAGQVILKASQVVPEAEQFRAGGDDSVRGYAYRSLGPLVDGAVGSGNAMFTVSAELARPILSSLPLLWGAVFVDAGNAAEKFAQLHPAVGAGFGLRYRSPVGPLRLDLAYGDQTRRVRLHFSVGIAL